MDPLAESMTVNNINTNKHVNLVQVKKIKSDNSASATISLDIIAGKCDYGELTFRLFFFCGSTNRNIFDFVVNHSDRVNPNCRSNSTARKTLLAFLWRKNIAYLMSNNRLESNEIAAVCGIQVMCSLWIILVHTCTVLFYVSGK